jgi:arylesterase/paraoxonase
VLVPFLKEKAPALKLLIANTPGRLQSYSAYSHKILFADKIRNCEDAVLDEDLGIAYMSCDPGRDRWNTVLVG